MTRARDSQRARVYRVEAMFSQDAATTPRLTVAECQAWVNWMTADPRFGAAFPRVARIYVTDGRGRKSGAARTRPVQGIGVLALPRFARHDQYILHEVAHVATIVTCGPDTAKHGPEFTAVLLFLTRMFRGAKAAATLRARNRQHRVRVDREVLKRLTDPESFSWLTAAGPSQP